MDDAVAHTDPVASDDWEDLGAARGFLTALALSLPCYAAAFAAIWYW